MIHFQNLESEGAFSFGEISLPLGNQGLALITGSNLDDFAGSVEAGASGASANGAGKSSLLEILTHNLFANTGKNVRKNQIVNTYYPNGYRSKLDLKIGQTSYSYIQTRNHNPLGTINQLHKDGKDLAIKGLEETQKSFQQAIKLTLEDWYATVYLSQQARHLFTRTDSNDLKKDMLARIFNLNYKQYLEETKKRLEQTKTALLKLKSSIASSKSQILAQLEALPYPTDLEFKTTMGQISDDYASVNNNLQEKIQIQTNYQKFKLAKATRENYQTQIQEHLIQAGLWNGTFPESSNFQSYIQEIQAGIQQIKKSISEYQSYIQVLKQRDQAFNELEDWKLTKEFQRLSDMEELQADRQSAYFQLGQLTQVYNEEYFRNLALLREQDYSQMPILKGQVESLLLQINDAQSSLREKDVLYRSAKVDWEKVQTGVCYACERPFPNEKVEVVKQDFLKKQEEFHASGIALNTLQAQFETINTQHRDLQKKFNTYENLRARLIDPEHGSWTVETFQKTKSLLEDKYRDLTSFLESIARCKSCYDKYQSFASIEGDCKTYEKALEDLVKCEASRSSSLMTYSSILTLIQQYEKLEIVEMEDLDDLQLGAEIRSLTDRANTLSNNLAVLKRDYEYFQDYSKQLAKILENEKEIDVLEKNEQIYQSLSYVFGPKGLIVSRLDIICKYLTEKVNYHLSRILREDITLKFLMDEDSLDLQLSFNGKERGVSNLSGGEASKVGLACMLGLRSLLPEEYQTNILILDEAEANWDDRVRHELVEMLEFLLTSTNLDSIFMVSHSNVIQNMQIWNTHLHCVKEKGISTLQITNR